MVSGTKSAGRSISSILRPHYVIKICSIVAIAICCCSVIAYHSDEPVAGVEGTCGENLTWTMDSEGNLVITGTGPMYDYSYGGEAWGGFAPSSVVLPDGLTTIGNHAFGQSTMISITIPDTVESIGDYAFGYCKNLTSVDIPDSVTSIGSYVFDECTSLASVTIGDHVETFGDSTFFHCTALTTVAIPDSATSVGSGMFNGCTSLSSVTLGNSVTVVRSMAFFECEALAEVIMPDSLETIEYSAFYGCSSLTSITIPEKVSEIASDALIGCTSLMSYIVDEDNSYYSSVDGVLFNKSGTVLIKYPSAKTTASYAIPDDVEEILQSAFEKCRYLTSVTIPASVVTVYSRLFYGCSALTTITVDEHSSYYSSIDGVLYLKDGTSLLSYPSGKTDTHFTIPNTVVSISNDAFATCSHLETVTIGESVETIGSNAFEGCTSLTSITIPDSVTEIPNYAFFGCSSLETVTFGNTLVSIEYSAFEGCTSLTSVTIPDSVISISNFAFKNCTSMESLEMNGSYTTTSSETFKGCTSLTTVTFNDALEAIGYAAFEGCTSLATIAIPDSVTAIDPDAFKNCTSLETVTFGNSVATIGYSAFEGCSSLTSITIPDSVTDISMNTFKNCTSLTSVTIGNHVETIGEGAFSYCKSLTSVTIPDSVTELGMDSFIGCSSLSSVSFGDSLETIGGAAFMYCSSLASVSFPDSLTEIGNFAFEGCSELREVTIPDSLNEIGTGAFNMCRRLNHTSIGEGVTALRSSVFSRCISLTSVDLPSGLTEIGDAAFYGCVSLTSITLPENLTSISGSAFDECRELVEVINLSPLKLELGSEENGCVAKYAKVLPSQSILRTTADDFVYYELEGRYYLISYAGDELRVVLPDNLEGHQYEIAENGLYFLGKAYQVIIPDGVTAIGEGALKGNPAHLRSVVIGGDVENIGSGYHYPFGDKLYEVVNNSENEIADSYPMFIRNGESTIGVDNDFVYSLSGGKYTVIGYLGDGNVLRLPDTICGHTYSVWGGAFHNLQSNITYSLIEIDNVIVSDGVDEISAEAFLGNYSLKEFEVTDGNTRYAVADGVLFSKDMRTLLAFPYGLVIDDYAIPDTVEHIGDGSFYYSNIQNSITMSNSVIDIGDNAFNSSSIDSITLSENLVSIGEYAFCNTRLTNVEIPDKVAEIGGYAFFYCSDLASIELPDSLESIGEYAFRGCTSLTSLRIPDSVEHAGFNILYECSLLESLWLSHDMDNVDIASHCPNLTYLSLDISVKHENTIFWEISFYDTDGITRLDNTAAELAGYVYEGTVDRMVRQATPRVVFTVNDEVEDVFIYRALDDVIVPPVVNLNEYNCEWPDFVLDWNEVVVEAILTPKTFNVTLDANGGTMDGETGFTYTYGNEVVLPSGNVMHPYERQNYIVSFVGWYLTSDQEHTIISSMPDTTYGDLSFTALWDEQPAPFTVRYLVDGNEVYSDSERYLSTVEVRPAYIMAGYTVSGWSTSDVSVTENRFQMPAGTVTFTATSEVNSYPYRIIYQCDFEYGGGFSELYVTSGTADYNSKVPVPIRQFEGYEPTGDEFELTIDCIESNNTVIQHYRPIYYEIQFLDDATDAGGTPVMLLYMIIGQYLYPDTHQNADLPPITEREGHVAEWGPLDLANRCMRAIYHPLDYRVTFYVNGALYHQYDAPYGSTIVFPSDPESWADNYNENTFVRWYGYPNDLILRENTMINAEISISNRLYEIRFVSDNVTVSSQMMRYGDIISLPADPSKPADAQYTYTFTGWEGYVRDMTVTGNATFMAIYGHTLNSYTVRFVSENETILSQTMDYGTVIVPPADPSKPADVQYTYTFARWEGYVRDMTVTGNATFMAIYGHTLNSYTVRFVSENEAVQSQKLDYGTVIILPANPSKPADVQYTYTFTGWEGYTENMKVSGDVTFTATFTGKLNVYDVVFYNADNQTQFWKKSLEYGSKVILPSSVPVKDAVGNTTYAFAGWEGFQANAVVTGPMSYRPVFVEGTQTVDDDGTITTTVEEGDTTTTTVYSNDGTSVSTATTSTQDSGNNTTQKVEEIRKDASGNITGTGTTVDIESADGKVKTSAELTSSADDKSASVETTVSSAVSNSTSTVTSADVTAALDQLTAAVNEVNQSKEDLELGDVSISQTITVDSTGGTSEKSTTVIDSSAMGSISQHGDLGLSLKADVGTISLDNSAVDNLTSVIGQGSISFTISKANVDELTESQKAIVKDNTVIMLSAMSGEKSIHQLGGKAVITIPYTLKEGEDAKNIIVWYVDDEGKINKMVTSYDESTKTVTFETDHFSYYVISQESGLGELGSGNNGGFPIIFVVIGVVAVLAVAAVVIIVMKKRNS